MDSKKYKKKYKDIKGQRFGKLVCLSFAGNDGKRSKWLCKCDCDFVKEILRDSLISGRTKSCGCGHINVLDNVKIKYGVTSPIQVPKIKNKIKKTNRKKYGVDHPMKNKEVALRSAKNSNNSYILQHWKGGQKLICQGSYEKKVVKYLNENMIEYDWQPKVFKMPGGGTYRPDLYLINEKQWIEIKGYFRKDAKEKWNWFHTTYKNSKLWDKNKLKKMRIL